MKTIKVFIVNIRTKFSSSRNTLLKSLSKTVENNYTWEEFTVSLSTRKLIVKRLSFPYYSQRCCILKAFTN